MTSRPAAPEAADRIVKHRQVVAAADVGRALRMDGLQPSSTQTGFSVFSRCSSAITASGRQSGRVATDSATTSSGASAV